MLSLLSVLVLSISANLDGLVVGFSYGVKKHTLSFLNLFIISFITFIGTLMSMSLGRFLSAFVPSGLPNFIGSSIIIIIGFYGLIKCVSNNDNNQIQTISFLTLKETVILGLALAINNFALGVGSSIAGFNTLTTSLCSFVVCFALVLSGNLLGNNLFKKGIGKATEIIANSLMIMIGLYEILI